MGIAMLRAGLGAVDKFTGKKCNNLHKMCYIR